MSQKSSFLVRCHYFKASGKWYADGECDMRVETLISDPLSPYINDACDQVRRMAAGHSTQSLPGLQSGTWDGPIVVVVVSESEDSYPTLLLPPHERP